MGGYVVGELNAQGEKTRQYVYAGGERLVEQWTIGGYTTINWQHRNPLTDSWVSVDPNQSFSFRTEVDAHGRETGLEPPTILPNEPPPPPTRDPSYVEMQGGATIEAELGMQLYEDFFLNNIYKGGHGPAEGSYDRLRTERESQLRAGGTFLVGQDRMIATAFGEYEEIGFGVGLQFIPASEIPPRPASWRPVTLTYYQLKPGLGGRKKSTDFSHSVKEAPQNSAIADAIARSDAQVDSNYTDCARLLNGSPAPSVEATKAILSTRIQEGGSATLLAVTWAAESSFSFTPYSNPNDGSANNADIGPMQINYRTFNGWTPLDNLGDVFGTTTTGRHVFDGNLYDNLRAGARILNSYGSGRTAAGRYRTGTGAFAQIPVGRAAFNARVAQYDRWSAGFDAFFDCLRR